MKQYDLEIITYACFKMAEQVLLKMHHSMTQCDPFWKTWQDCQYVLTSKPLWESTDITKVSRQQPMLSSLNRKMQYVFLDIPIDHWKALILNKMALIFVLRLHDQTADYIKLVFNYHTGFMERCTSMKGWSQVKRVTYNKWTLKSKHHRCKSYHPQQLWLAGKKGKVGFTCKD